MYVAGNIIGLGGPLSADFSPTGDTFADATVARINERWEQGVGGSLAWRTPEQVRALVRAYIESSGIDFVKYAGSAHVDMQFIVFSADAQRAIVEEGHRAGLRVQAHTTSVESLRMEIAAGADLLQHGDVTGLEPMPDETLAEIVERQIPVAAMVSTERHLAWNEKHGTEPLRTIRRVMDGNDRRLIERGARLLLTTDALAVGSRVGDHPRMRSQFGSDVPDLPQLLGEAHFLWLEAVVERGMDPMAALLAGTRNIAEAYGREADLGTLEPGKVADLVVLDGNPLDDVRNYRRIAEVVKGGVVVDRSALPHRRILTDPEGPR
jgi:imidazolonepropionase-like amidohydrolase